MAAEHLIATANPEHMPATAQVRAQIGLPAGGTQSREIGDGRLRARQDDERGITGDRFAGAHEHHVDLRLLPQRIEVVEVGDTRIGQHGNANCAAGGADVVRQAEGIFGRQPVGVLEEGDQSQRLPSRVLLDQLHAIGKQSGITTEAIDDEAHDHGWHRRDRSPSWCRPGLRSRRHGRCRRPTRRAR